MLFSLIQNTIKNGKSKSVVLYTYSKNNIFNHNTGGVLYPPTNPVEDEDIKNDA